MHGIVMFQHDDHCHSMIATWEKYFTTEKGGKIAKIFRGKISGYTFPRTVCTQKINMSSFFVENVKKLSNGFQRKNLLQPMRSLAKIWSM